MEIVKWKEIINFEPYETECRCGCGRNDVSHELMLLMDKFRFKVNRPVHFASVCRCLQHNEDEGAEFSSSHVNGPVVAVDIVATTSKQRFETIEFLILNGFTRIGIAKGFIHGDFDARPVKVKRIVWLY